MPDNSPTAYDTFLSSQAVIEWKSAVSANGGVAWSGGYPFDPYKGAPVEIYPDKTTPGGKRYVVAPLTIRIRAGFRDVAVKRDEIAGDVAGAAEQTLKDVGLDNGIFGFLGKITGLPHGVVAALAIGAGLVVGYAALVQIGIAPPIKKVLG